MMWFFAVLVVAVMGLAATAATGRLGGLGETYDDRPDSLVPADRPLTAEDLEGVRFTSALRGYRMAEVDALLDRLAEELRAARETGDRPGDRPGERTADEPGLEPEPGER